MEYTSIEWADHTLNAWTGCTKISPGCDNCYAASWAKRTSTVKWGPGEIRRRTREANWQKARIWNADALACRFRQFTLRDGRVFRATIGELTKLFDKHGFTTADIVSDTRARPRIFVNSLSDWLDPEADIVALADLLEFIGELQHLDFLLLTKRPQLWKSRMQAAMACSTDPFTVAAMWHDGYPPKNAWVGTTAETSIGTIHASPTSAASPRRSASSAWSRSWERWT